MGCFSGCLMSSAGIHKLFCGIYSAFKCSFDDFVGEIFLTQGLNPGLPHCRQTLYRLSHQGRLLNNHFTEIQLLRPYGLGLGTQDAGTLGDNKGVQVGERDS